MDNFDLRKFLADQRLLKEQKEQLDENWKAQLAGFLLAASLVGAATKGVSFLQHRQMEKVEQALEAGKTVKVTSRNAITSDTPLKTDSYDLKYDPSQSEPISVDVWSNTISVNTLDMSTTKFRRAVRDAIQRVRPGGAVRDQTKIPGIHIDIKD